ncbi:MAG: PAS domain-containing protein [Dongiaceae bacterium]
MASESVGFEIEAPPKLADARLQSLYDYWHALGVQAGGLPSLQSFDPLRLPKLLANIWALEVAPDTHRFRMRLAGENINAIYGRNIAGQFFSDIFEAHDLPTIVERYSRALHEPAIFCATGRVYAAAARYWVGERLGLPMLGRSGQADTLLGATVYGGRTDPNMAVLITGDVPRFHPIKVANHRPVEIAGG